VLQSRIAFGHNSFVLNEHFNTDGTIDKTKVTNTIVVDERETQPDFRDLRDAYHLTTGGVLGRTHKGLKGLRLSGRIMVPDASQQASLSDRERAFLAAFDPALCYRDSPTTDGAYSWDFSEATADTATYPTGRISLRYYLRPDRPPRVVENLKDRSSRLFALSMVGADPRLYEQTEQTLSLTPGSASGNVVNRGTVPAPLKATITMAGAGHASFTVTRGGVAFILNLSGMVNGDVVVVIFETCAPYGRGRLITKNGVENFALKTSSPSTWLDAPVGTTSFAISNHTNVTSCVLAWRSARA
jgi:hypothetical protein